MKPSEALKKQLQGLDGRDYGACQSLLGAWAYSDFSLFIDRIPKDPFAPAGTGVFRIRVTQAQAGFSKKLLNGPDIREVAFRDFLARAFHRLAHTISQPRRGTGNSGLIAIAEGGQKVLERNSVVLGGDFIEARIFVGLPAKGRKINADLAVQMLFEELPKIVKGALFAESLSLPELNTFLDTAEDALFLRESLAGAGLVAFVANGAVLARASGVDPRPKALSEAVPFQTPESLQVTFELPHRGAVSGMGIPKGITLIVGGGYHGKSTLLETLEACMFGHIPGDGRAYCASASDTVKIRAGNGRSVVRTDISAFIQNLPSGGDTSDFSTQNASGSTSQAASLAEAVEMGAKVLLMDEDTCATNFMVRDKRMQELVTKKDEPITAFVDKVKQLSTQHEISTVLVMGGSGDYFGVADTVIQMKAFAPLEVTKRAHEIAGDFQTGRAAEGGGFFPLPRPRCPLPEGIHPFNDYGQQRIQAPETKTLVFGEARIDLSDIEQMFEKGQTKAIGEAIFYAKKYMDGKKTLKEIALQVATDIETHGLDLLDPEKRGYLAQFRPLEFAQALNRMRSLTIKTTPKAE